jgi:hypothetical protein
MIMPADYAEENFLQEKLNALNRRLAAISHLHNTSADPAMGGLSPAQVAHLLYAEWGQPSSATQFNAGLPLAALKASPFFMRTRAILLAIHQADGVKMTSGKNLQRQFVSEMVNLLLDDKERELVWRHNKVLNEHNVPALHIPRVVAQAAGMLRPYKGKLVVPKKRSTLLQNEHAAILYRDLFIAFFRRFNLAYLQSYGPGAAALQMGVPYTLYRLGIVATEWRKTANITEDITLPGIREQIAQEVENSQVWIIDVLVVWRILKPLIEWGLLEARSGIDKYDVETLEAVRVSPLYRAFLHIETDASYRPNVP